MSTVLSAQRVQPLPDRESEVSRSRIYIFDSGILYAGPLHRAFAGEVIKRRREATISLAIPRASFGVCIGEVTESFDAVAIKGLVECRIEPNDVPMVSALVAPNHPRYRSFRSIPRSGLQLLARDAFTSLDGDLTALEAGELEDQQAWQLFDSIVETTVGLLPALKPIDTRVDQAIDILRNNIDYPLEELAKVFRISYYRMSHLFTENVGLSLRSYQLWLRIYKAFGLLLRDGRKHADIVRLAGFTDISHFRRVVYESYGVPPSFFLDKRVVVVSFFGKNAQPS